MGGYRVGCRSCAKEHRTPCRRRGQRCILAAAWCIVVGGAMSASVNNGRRAAGSTGRPLGIETHIVWLNPAATSVVLGLEV